MRKCPNIIPNPYEIEGAVRACHDFQKINTLAATIIERYSVYEANKAKLNDEFFEGAEYIEMCGEVYQEKLQELRAYVETRSAENWR